jgi:hypothetical protein
MIRAVIDTNILVSAMISSVGNEALLILAINHGLVIPCFSADIPARLVSPAWNPCGNDSNASTFSRSRRSQVHRVRDQWKSYVPRYRQQASLSAEPTPRLQGGQRRRADVVPYRRLVKELPSQKIVC